MHALTMDCPALRGKFVSVRLDEVDRRSGTAVPLFHKKH